VRRSGRSMNRKDRGAEMRLKYVIKHMLKADRYPALVDNMETKQKINQKKTTK